MYLKRTVLLTNLNEENKLLLIVEKSEKVLARIKGASRQEKLWMALKFNNAPIIFQRMQKEGEEFFFELEKYVNMNDVICCAVFSRPALDCVFYGGTDGKEEFYSEFVKSFDEFVRQINYQSELDDSVKAEDVFESDEEEIERQIDSELTNELVYECLSKCDEDKCKDCIYKRAFFENKNNCLNSDKFDEEVENEEDIVDKKVTKNNQFYYSIEGSLNDLFANYPSDEVLEEKIASSKFVKVDYENDGNYYSVGVIYDEDGVEEYICYAIFGKKDCPPPKELSEFSQFLPIDEENGYYLMYQNAEDGKSISIQNSQTD